MKSLKISKHIYIFNQKQRHDICCHNFISKQTNDLKIKNYLLFEYWKEKKFWLNIKEKDNDYWRASNLITE